MKIVTARFGEIEVEEAKIINMDDGIIGFEHAPHYVVIEHDKTKTFCWFQSLNDGKLAFVVINPHLIKSDYEPVIDDCTIDELDIQGAHEVALMAIVTIRSNPPSATANLRAPLVINVRNRKAKQVILEGSDYPIQYDIFGNKTDFDRSLSEARGGGMSRLVKFSPAPASGDF